MKFDEKREKARQSRQRARQKVAGPLTRQRLARRQEREARFLEKVRALFNLP